MSNYLVYICQAVRDRAGLEPLLAGSAGGPTPRTMSMCLQGMAHARCSTPIRRRRVEGVVGSRVPSL